MPEGRAGRRAAVVRPGRRQQGSPTGADGRGCKRPEGRRGAQRSPAPTDDGNREGGPGRKAAGDAPSRQGATPRRDPGDCNAGRLPRRSLKRARRTSRAWNTQSMRPGKRAPREDQQGRCRALGQRNGPATPLPERGRKDAGGVTGLEQRNALARRLPTA